MQLLHKLLQRPFDNLSSPPSKSCRTVWFNTWLRFTNAKRHRYFFFFFLTHDVYMHSGEAVGTDDIVLQIETDKVTVDVRYTTGKPGKLKEMLVKEEDTVAVGQEVAIVTEGEEGSQPDKVKLLAFACLLPTLHAADCPAALPVSAYRQLCGSQALVCCAVAANMLDSHHRSNELHSQHVMCSVIAYLQNACK